MIAANDSDMGFLLEMAPDQLRILIAHAGGLLAHHCGEESSARTLRRVADRVLYRDPKPLMVMSKSVLSKATRDAIIRQVSEETEVEAEAILSKSRKRPIATARMLAMYRLRECKGSDGIPKYSYPEIGRAFGVDHTTVQHACQKVRTWIAGEASV